MTEQPTCSRCPNAIAWRGLCRKHYDHYCAQRKRSGIPWYTPADECRQHAQALRDAGLSLDRIGRLAGVSDTLIMQLCRGDLVRVRHETHTGILDIPLPVATYTAATDRARVDPTGTLRRLRALVAFGYTQRDLAGRIGMFETNFGEIIRATHPQVAASTARRVETLYDELTAKPPVRPSKSAIRRAEARGWAPPLAWDDETIDDPEAKPQHNIHRRVRFAERYEELREIERVPVKKVSAVVEYFETVLNEKPENVQRQIDRYKATERKAHAS